MQYSKYGDYEAEVDVIDIATYIAYHWRRILVAAFICAVVFFVCRSIVIIIPDKNSGISEIQRIERDHEIALREYYSGIESSEAAIIVNKTRLDDVNRYVDGSVLLKIDWQNDWSGTKRYQVKLADAVLNTAMTIETYNPMQYVQSAYSVRFKANLDEAEMQSLLGTSDRRFINEVVGLNLDVNSGTMTIWARGASEDYVKRAIDYFSARIEKSSAEVLTIVEHHLVPSDTETICRYNKELYDKRAAIEKDIKDIDSTITETEKVINTLRDEGEPEPDGKGRGKFAVIGFFVGVFIVCGRYAFKYIYGGTLHRGDEISLQYSLPIYGDMMKKSFAKTPGKGIDGIIDKIRLRKAIPEETVYDSIAVLIKESAYKSILFAGTISKEVLNQAVEQLKKRFDSELQLSVRADFLNDPYAIAEAKRMQAVVLVEKKELSKISDIDRMVEMLSISGANVIGAVVL